MYHKIKYSNLKVRIRRIFVLKPFCVLILRMTCSIWVLVKSVNFLLPDHGIEKHWHKRKRRTEPLMLCLSVVYERAITNILLCKYCKYERNFYDVCHILRGIPHLWLAMLFSLSILFSIAYFM